MSSQPEISQIEVVCALWFIGLIYAYFFDRFFSKKFSSSKHAFIVFIVGVVFIAFIVFIVLRFVAFQ